MGLIIGIDPGLRGGICVLRVNAGGSLDKPCLFKMPVRVEGVGRVESGRDVVDGFKLAEIIHTFAGYPVGNEGVAPLAVIEKVQSSSQMGVVSAFRFGQAFGVVQGVAESFGLKIIEVTPQVWKGALGLIGRTKKDSVALAVEKFGLKKSWGDGPCEAALLAHYGLRFLPKIVKKTGSGGIDELL